MLPAICRSRRSDWSIQPVRRQLARCEKSALPLLPLSWVRRRPTADASARIPKPPLPGSSSAARPPTFQIARSFSRTRRTRRAPPLAARLAPRLKLQVAPPCDARLGTARLVQAQGCSPPPRCPDVGRGQKNRRGARRPSQPKSQKKDIRLVRHPHRRLLNPHVGPCRPRSCGLAARPCLRRNMNRPPLLANAPPREPVNLRRRAGAPTKLANAQQGHTPAEPGHGPKCRLRGDRAEDARR